MALLDRIGAFWPSTNGKHERPVYPVLVTQPRAPVETKGLGVTLGGSFFSPNGTRTIYRLDGTPSSEAETVTRHTAFAAALYAYAAIRYRAEKYSEPALYVAEMDDDQEDWLEEHELAALLDSPSLDYDMGELLRLSRMYRDITGSCVWLKEPTRGGGIDRLTPFSGDEVMVEPADGRIHGRFRITLAGGRQEVFPPERVVYFRETNPYGWSSGLAPLDAALGMLNLGQTATTTVKALLKNALFPSVIIQTDAGWNPTETEWEDFKASIDQYASQDRKGAPLTLHGGGTVTAVAMRLKDLMPDDVLDRVEASVAAAFGIPPVVLGFLAGLKNSPWSQMAEARRMTYEDTIEPMWRRDEKALTRQLLLAPVDRGRQPLDADPSHVVRFDGGSVRALQADRKTQADIAKLWADMRIARRNELRVQCGLEPSDDPADDELPAFEAPVAPNPFGAPTGEPDDDAKAATKAAISDPRAVRWMIWDAVVRSQEFAWKLTSGALLQQDRAKALQLAGETLEAAKAAPPALDTKDDAPPPPFGADPESVRQLIKKLEAALGDPAEWTGPMRALVQETAKRAVEAAARDLGISFDLLQPEVIRYAERHAAKLVTGIGETTRDAMRSTLTAGLEEGDGISELTKRISEAGAFGESRAELIARTETTTVTNNAGREATSAWAKGVGAKVEKSWLSARDGRVREEHKALDDGKWIPVDQPFPNGLQAPGEPNCRCTQLFRVVEGR